MRWKLLLSIAAMCAASAAPGPATSKTMLRRPPVRFGPIINLSVLSKEAVRHTHVAQLEAERNAIGPRGKLGAFHRQTVAGTKPAIVATKSGLLVLQGKSVPVVTVSVVAYGLYPGDPIPLTRQIDYTYNAQNGVLINESARVADAATASRFRLPALRRAGRATK